MERGRIRNAVITAAQVRETHNGGIIVCRTNRTGLYWIMLAKDSYLGMAGSVHSQVAKTQVPEIVSKKLIGMSCDISVTHYYNKQDIPGVLAHTWDGRVYLPGVFGLSDYRLGDGGHG